MRITQRDLEAVVRRINSKLNRPQEPWGKDETGKLRANIGNFHLDHAYGGVKLEEMDSDGGGVNDVLRCGYTTKKELYNLMQAFLTGLEVEK